MTGVQTCALPIYAAVLDVRVNRDGTHAKYRPAFIQTIATDHLTVELSDDAPESRMVEHHGKQTDPVLGSGQIRWEAVRRRDLVERFVANATADFGVLRLSAADDKTAGAHRKLFSGGAEET